MTSFIRQRAHELGVDDDVDLLALRYRAAYDEYHHVYCRNAEVAISGGRPSKQARDEEEQALIALDGAREALLDGALLAFPTVH